MRHAAAGRTASAGDNDASYYRRTPPLPEPITPETVERLVQQVSSRYVEQIFQERRAPTPDPERLKVLQEALEACAADREALQDADEDEVAEIAARYAARARELNGE